MGIMLKLSIVPIDGICSHEVCLDVKKDMETAFNIGKKQILGHIISSVSLYLRVFRLFNTIRPPQRWPATG